MFPSVLLLGCGCRPSSCEENQSLGARKRSTRSANKPVAAGAAAANTNGNARYVDCVACALHSRCPSKRDGARVQLPMSVVRDGLGLIEDSIGFERDWGIDGWLVRGAGWLATRLQYLLLKSNLLRAAGDTAAVVDPKCVRSCRAPPRRRVRLSAPMPVCEHVPLGVTE